MPLFPPSPLPLSSHLISLTHSPFSPHLPHSSFYTFLVPSPPLIYSSFPLTSLPFSLSSLFSSPSFRLPSLLSENAAVGWLVAAGWLAVGGYSFIIPPRLPDRLATMSQELNICLYYLLV